MKGIYKPTAGPKPASNFKKRDFREPFRKPATPPPSIVEKSHHEKEIVDKKQLKPKLWEGKEETGFPLSRE